MKADALWMYTLRPAHFLSPFVYSLSHVSIPSSNRVSFFHHCAFKIIPRSIYFNRANKIQKYFSSYVLAQESFFFDPGKDNHRSFSSSYVAFNVPPLAPFVTFSPLPPPCSLNSPKWYFKHCRTAILKDKKHAFCVTVLLSLDRWFNNDDDTLMQGVDRTIFDDIRDVGKERKI